MIALAIVVAAGFGFVAGVLFLLPDVKRLKLQAECWFNRAVALGWDDYTNYPITAQQAEKIVADLFPERKGKPFPGTIPWPGLNVPSIEQDAADAKAWRERRATRGIDHRPTVVIEDIENSPANDGFAAYELLKFTVGGDE